MLKAYECRAPFNMSLRGISGCSNLQLVQEHKAFKSKLAQTEGLLTALVREHRAMTREHEGKIPRWFLRAFCSGPVCFDSQLPCCVAGLQMLRQKLAMVGSAQTGIASPSKGFGAVSTFDMLLRGVSGCAATFARAQGLEKEELAQTDRGAFDCTD